MQDTLLQRIVTFSQVISKRSNYHLTNIRSSGITMLPRWPCLKLQLVFKMRAFSRTTKQSRISIHFSITSNKATIIPSSLVFTSCKPNIRRTPNPRQLHLRAILVMALRHILCSMDPMPHPHNTCSVTPGILS